MTHVMEQPAVRPGIAKCAAGPFRANMTVMGTGRADSANLWLDRPCNPAETSVLVGHLVTDKNAAWAARALLAGEVVAWRATVPDRQTLGLVNTGFVVLGKTYASDVYQRRYFRVGEARVQWRASAVDDASAYQKLDQYIQNAGSREGIRNKTITLLDDANGRRVIDGNKRAIALYERGADSEVHLLLVHVLFPAGLQPESGREAPTGYRASRSR